MHATRRGHPRRPVTFAELTALRARLRDGDPSVVLVQPEMERLAQWTMRDVPRLIAEGRRAADAALEPRPSPTSRHPFHEPIRSER